MASTTQGHPSFPSRPYSSTLHGKLPERTGTGAFGTSTHPASREAARLERERAQGGGGGGQTAGPANPMSNITDEQREEINEAFNLFDLDKDQKIDYHEFKVALKALGFDLPKAEILELLTTHGIPPEPVPTVPGAPQSGRQMQVLPHNQQPPNIGKLVLTLPAFQAIAAKLVADRDPRDEILRAFALFDSDGKGMISVDDLRRVARELGEGLEEDELMSMIEEFDLDGKGGVGRDEFINICMG